MAQKPLTKTQANAAFLKQSNHFTRLGTPSNDDAKLLLNSLASMLSVLTGKEDIRIRFDFHDAEPEVLITNPRHAEPQWGINWPEEPSSYRYFAVKDEWEALEMANAAREWTKNQFAEQQFHLEIYPVMWEVDFGDHTENLAQHYESLKADLEKCESWAFEKIGYADKDLKFYSIADYWDSLKARSNINAHYPVFAHIIKSGEHGLETPTLRTIRDDIDQLLSVVKIQPVTVAESAPVELARVGQITTPDDATHQNLQTGCFYKLIDGEAYYFSFDDEVWRPCGATAHDLDVAAHIIRLPVTTPTRPEPIESLSLTIRAESALVAASIKTIPELLEKTESDLLKLEGFGKKSLADVKTNLEQRGLTLGSAK